MEKKEMCDLRLGDKVFIVSTSLENEVSLDLSIFVEAVSSLERIHHLAAVYINNKYIIKEGDTFGIKYHLSSSDTSWGTRPTNEDRFNVEYAYSLGKFQIFLQKEAAFDRLRSMVSDLHEHYENTKKVMSDKQVTLLKDFQDLKNKHGIH